MSEEEVKNEIITLWSDLDILVNRHYTAMNELSDESKICNGLKWIWRDLKRIKGKLVEYLPKK